MNGNEQLQPKKKNEDVLLWQQLKLSDGTTLLWLRKQRKQSAGEQQQQQKKNGNVLPKRRYAFCS